MTYMVNCWSAARIGHGLTEFSMNNDRDDGDDDVAGRKDESGPEAPAALAHKKHSAPGLTCLRREAHRKTNNRIQHWTVSLRTCCTEPGEPSTH